MIQNLLSFVGVVSNAGDKCDIDNDNLLGFPHWYDYLQGAVDPQGNCVPKVTGLSDVWLVVAAIIEILLRVAVLVAVAMIIYGGFSYVTSQGEPDKTASARNTIINAVIGLAIAIMASFIVTFIAGRIS
jgi:hypothetical protein